MLSLMGRYGLQVWKLDWGGIVSRVEMHSARVVSDVTTRGPFLDRPLVGIRCCRTISGDRQYHQGLVPSLRCICAPCVAREKRLETERTKRALKHIEIGRQRYEDLVREDELRASRSLVAVCPGCGCDGFRRCEIVLADALGTASCVPAGVYDELCSACSRQGVP